MAPVTGRVVRPCWSVWVRLEGARGRLHDHLRLCARLGREEVQEVKMIKVIKEVKHGTVGALSVS